MAVEKQHDVGVTQAIAEAGTILRAEVGSTVHGLGVAGTDDRDEMGVCIEPPDYVIGLRHFENFVYRTQAEGARSGPGDLDLTIYSLRKFCSLALKGNPSILLLFFVPDEKCSVMTEMGERLREISGAFASQKAGAAFLGYMHQQRERLEGKRGQMNVKRPELVDRYGYDTKYAGHIVRLAFQGIDYMSTGRLIVPMPVDQAEYILAVRTGQVTQEQLLLRSIQLEQELKEAIAASSLPALPDYDRVNDFLIDAYTTAWG